VGLGLWRLYFLFFFNINWGIKKMRRYGDRPHRMSLERSGSKCRDENKSRQMVKSLHAYFVLVIQPFVIILEQISLAFLCISNYCFLA
jgi:hypothetical protein